jgi:DNA invertase Pin-like site-specific DNA recombinase
MCTVVFYCYNALHTNRLDHGAAYLTCYDIDRLRRELSDSSKQEKLKQAHLLAFYARKR